MFPIVPEDEISFTECAAGNALECVNSAGIVLNNRDDLLILGPQGI
jgi:hypothetical protein